MNVILKPCPFCGGKAALSMCSDGDDESGYYALHSVYCIDCGSRTDDDIDRSTMITRWNTRVADPEVVRLTELLNDVCNYARRNPMSSPQCVIDLVEVLK